jgi:dTDP-4-amino-4,6-dideoxygalactose transaminase
MPPEVARPPERRVPIARPSLGQEEWLALRRPLVDGWLTQGPQVAAFEREFAARHGVDEAVATTSCTAALHLALAALGVGAGDEVIVPAFTWVATANVVLYLNATPVLVDVDPATFNIDPAHVARARSPRTRAVIAVHLFGRCAEFDALATAAPGVPIVEDAACAVGASYRGRPAGSLGVAGCFSFHPRKTITTGEGGMITTNDRPLAERIRVLRNHGASISEEERHRGPAPHRLPEFNLLGYNYRMTDLQGALGRVQLTKLDRFLLEREAAAARYAAELEAIPWLRLPEAAEGSRHGWQAYVCRVDERAAGHARDELMCRLRDRGIETRPGTHALHRLGCYRERFGFVDDDFPAAAECERTSLAIPLHNEMTEDDYRRVVAALFDLNAATKARAA